MKISRRFWQPLMVCLFTFILVSQAFAQESLGRGGSSLMAPRKVRCPACAYLTNLYNQAREDVLDQEDYLDELDSDLYHLDQQLTTLENHISDLNRQFLRNPSQSLAQRSKSTLQEHRSLSKDFGRKQREFDRADRHYDDLLNHFDDVDARLNDCEARYCKPGVYAHPMSQLLYYHYMTTVQFGLLFGNYTSYRSGYIDATGESFKGSRTQNFGVFGPQLRLMLGSPEVMHAFILMNALAMFNATNQFLLTRTDPGSQYDSRLRLITAWTAHFLVGLQTRTFLNRLNLSAGVGGAVLDQTLKTSIAEDVITTQEASKVSLAPSWMLSLDYKLCANCFGGKDLSLSAQLMADKYPSVSDTVTTPLGNTYTSKSNGHWDYTEALVLSMQF